MESSDSDGDKDSDDFLDARKKKSSKKVSVKKHFSEDENHNSDDKSHPNEDSSSEDNDDEDEWSAGDAGVDYGEAEHLSENSADWDCRSAELYDSDNPDCPLNAYHVQSEPRLVQIEDFDEDGKQVLLLLDCLKIPDPSQQKQEKKANRKLAMLNRNDKAKADEPVNHFHF